MVLLPNPGVLDHLIRERQQRMRMRPVEAQAAARGGLRVRIGHALIMAGSALSGERVEVPARPSAFQGA
jgi:hypothetical protein